MKQSIRKLAEKQDEFSDRQDKEITKVFRYVVSHLTEVDIHDTLIPMLKNVSGFD